MDVQTKIEEIVKEIAFQHGLEVVEVSLKGHGKRQMLKIIIDKMDIADENISIHDAPQKNGVTLDECESVSRALSAHLDVEEPIRGPYTIEVSSPGLDRPLKEKRDFTKNKGKLVKIVVKEKVNNLNFITGRLTDSSDDGIVVYEKGMKYDIGYDNISRAKLEIEIK